MSVDIDSVIDRSEALLVTGRHDRAVALVAQALAQMPECGRLHGQLSKVLAASRKWPAALDAARRAVEVEPNEPLLWLHLGVALAGCDDLSAAEAAARHGLSVAGSELPAGLNLLACILFDQGGSNRLLEAERLLMKAVELSPEDPEYRYMLARVAAASGNEFEAGRQLTAGLGIDPLHKGLLLMRAQDPSRTSDGRVRSLMHILEFDPHEVLARLSLEQEFFRIRIRRHMAWWLLCVFDAYLMMWVSQLSFSIVAVMAWLVLIPVAWVNGGTRNSLPKKYSRRMARKYPAATWAGRAAVAASASAPFVTVALYDDHGTVLGNLVVSALLLAATVAYSAYRWLVIRARHNPPESQGAPTHGLQSFLGENVTNMVTGTMVGTVVGAVVAGFGIGGPQPAAAGIFLLTVSIGLAWWWVALNVVDPLYRRIRQPNCDWRGALAVGIFSAFLTGMMIVGLGLIVAHDFTLISNNSLQ